MPPPIDSRPPRRGASQMAANTYLVLNTRCQMAQNFRPFGLDCTSLLHLESDARLRRQDRVRCTVCHNSHDANKSAPVLITEPETSKSLCQRCHT